VIKQPQTSILAAFGSFAILVLVEFGGPPRKRFAAYVGLAFVGAFFITLGTLCSRNPWLAAGAMAVVGFVTLFSGVLGGYFAADSDRSDPHVRPAGNDSGTELRDSGPPRRLGPCGRRGDLRGHAPLAAPP